MKILVLTKRTLIIAAAVLLLLITAIILLLSFAPNAAAANGFRNVEEYELEVLAGKKRELPIYSVTLLCSGRSAAGRLSAHK